MKIAIILTGYLRDNYVTNFDTINKFLLNKIDNYDFFIHTWHQISEYNKLLVDKDILQDLYKTNNIIIENQNDTHIKDIITNINYKVKTFPFQFYSLKKIYDTFHDKLIYYDYIIKFRPDIGIRQQVNLIFDDKIHFFHTIKTGGGLDVLYYGKSSHILKTLLIANDHILTKTFTLKKPEIIFIKYWDKYNILYLPYNIDFFKIFVIENIEQKKQKQILYANKTFNNNKKLAIVFFGFHYIKSYNNYNIHNKNTIIDFRHSVDNYKLFIFDFFFKLKYDIDIFFSTYSSPINDELLKTYQPKKYIFSTNIIQDRHLSRNRHFENGLLLVDQYQKEQNIKYDNILITRFDIFFKIPFHKTNLQLDKINLVSSWFDPIASRTLLDDNFYVIHQKHLDFFKKISHYAKSFHLIRKRINKQFIINYITQENISDSTIITADTTFYKIIRNYL